MLSKFYVLTTYNRRVESTVTSCNKVEKAIDRVGH